MFLVRQSILGSEGQRLNYDGTIKSLVSLYETHPASGYRRLAPATKRVYVPYANRWVRLFAGCRIAELTELDVINFRALRMRHLDLDHDAGLQSGYAGKIFCGMKNFGPLTLGPILDALGVDIVLVPRQAGTEVKLPENVLQFAHITRLRNYATLGGRMRRAMMTDAEWSKHCRAAAKARWRKAHKNAKLAAQFNPRAPVEAVV
jgi:hypothetical protein